MLVQCPRCQTKYNLDPSLLGPQGSQVRCSRCGNEFLAQAQAEPAPQPQPIQEESPPYTPPSAPQSEPPPPEEDLIDFLDEGEGGKGRKKGSLFKKLLAFLLILIILAGLLIGGTFYLKTRGINLDQQYLGVDFYDYLSFLRPQTPAPEIPVQGGEALQDPGNKRIHLAGVAGSFLDLEDQKKVFLIKGKVKTSYGYPDTEIKLRGILHTKDRRNAVESIVFTGHLVSDEEIKSLSRAVIEGLLSSPQLDEGETVGIETGKTSDFMIAFFDLPENLVEYTVEVISSRRVPDKTE